MNVSPTELRRRGFEHEVVLAVGGLADDAGWGIDIEVTEGALLGDSSSCVRALRLMRNAGIRIAIDDFGTGYSSLARLSELPIDTLKIDRVFTRRLPDDRRSGTLVATIIDLAHAFDMTTVAEGVETAGQLDYLARAGCDESQGFLHSRPIPRREFEQLLATVNANRCRSRVSTPWIPLSVIGAAADKIVDCASAIRGVAQTGRAPRLGRGCRRFESCRPDH